MGDTATYVGLDIIAEVDARVQGAGLFVPHMQNHPAGKLWYVSSSSGEQICTYLDDTEHQFRFSNLSQQGSPVRGILIPAQIEVDYTSSFSAVGRMGNPGDLIVNAGIAAMVAVHFGGHHDFDSERIGLAGTGVAVSAETGFSRWRLVAMNGEDKIILWARS
jgi:hypothetical protein